MRHLFEQSHETFFRDAANEHTVRGNFFPFRLKSRGNISLTGFNFLRKQSFFGISELYIIS